MAKPYRHPTKNNLPDNAKEVSIDILEKRIAASIDLALITKQAHWNLKGPQFIGIHEMLDGFRDVIDDGTDKMAERIVQLGGTAFGTSQEVVKRTALKPYPTDIYTIHDHLMALIDNYAQVANDVRKSIEDTDEAGDKDTADIFTEVSRELDKALWFLEAHVQEPSSLK